MQRAEKGIVEGRGLVQQDELHPPTINDVSWRMGRDGRRRKIVTTRLLREVKGRVIEKYLAHRLRKLNIRIICVPMGMQRHTENRTTLHRRTQCINWQVEWLVMARGGGGGGDDTTAAASPKRTLAKTMDDEPLYRAYHNANHQEPSRRQTKGVWYGAQNPSDATWFRGMVAVQEPQTGRWLSQDPGKLPDLWPSELDEELSRKWDFYLARPRQQPGELVQVTALEAHDNLRAVLANTNVLEFPTIYVLDKGEALPAGFALGPKDTVRFMGPKRKDGPGANRDEPATKRRKQRGEAGRGRGRDEGLEEGEIGGDGEELPDDSNRQQDDGAYQGAMEVGEVLEEHSYGEESEGDDNNAEEDDTTSSSGSDSEGD